MDRLLRRLPAPRQDRAAQPATEGQWPAKTAKMRPRILKDAGLTALGEPVRHPKHIEIPARTGTGKTVIVSLDRFGRLDEIEDADRDRERRPAQSIGPADAERIAREAGYSIREAPEQRKHHYEILATNAKGEILELHMDFAGNIYKQVSVR